MSCASSKHDTRFGGHGGNRQQAALRRCQKPKSQGSTMKLCTRHVYVQIVLPENGYILSVVYTCGPPGANAERVDRPPAHTPKNPNSTQYGSSSQARCRERHQRSIWQLKAFISAHLPGVVSGVLQRKWQLTTVISASVKRGGKDSEALNRYEPSLHWAGKLCLLSPH